MLTRNLRTPLWLSAAANYSTTEQKPPTGQYWASPAAEWILYEPAAVRGVEGIPVRGVEDLVHTLIQTKKLKTPNSH